MHGFQGKQDRSGGGGGVFFKSDGKEEKFLYIFSFLFLKF